MGRELEIKRRQLSNHPQHLIRNRQSSAIDGSTEHSQQKEGVRRLVPSTPTEQVEMLKTNVGRLKICKRHIVPTTLASSGLSSDGSKGSASRLKLVRPNRVLGGQSIFDSNGKQKVSIKEKISQSVVPLNSNQFSKGEDGRWTKLDQPTKKLSILNLKSKTNKQTNEKRLSYRKGSQGQIDSDREEHDENQQNIQEEQEDHVYEDKEEELSEIVEQKKVDRKSYKEEQSKGNKMGQSSQKNVSNKGNSQINTKTLNPNSNSSNSKQQPVLGEAQSISGSNNSSNLIQKQPPSNTDQPTLFVVAVNNLPRKCTESDIRSLIISEKKDLVDVTLEEGDSYDCLLYFSNEASQLRTVKLLDNKKYEGQILRADPAEVIIENQDNNNEESQREIEEKEEQQEEEEQNYAEDYEGDDRYAEEIRQRTQNQNSKIQQQQQLQKNLISSHIRSNEQTRLEYSSQQNQGSNTKSISQVPESSKSSRLAGQSSQMQQEISSKKHRDIEQQESRNLKNNGSQQNQQSQQRQEKQSRKEYQQQQQQQRDSPSRSRERTSSRYNNNDNYAGQTHERSAGWEDISESRSNSGRKRSESGNQYRNRRSPSPRYNNQSNPKKSDSRQQNIIKRSRYQASPIRESASPPRDRRNNGNNRERISTNDRRRDSNNDRLDRDNNQRKQSRDRNSRRRESPRRDVQKRR